MRWVRKPTYVDAEEGYDIEKDRPVYIVTHESGHVKRIPKERFESEYDKVDD